MFNRKKQLTFIIHSMVLSYSIYFFSIRNEILNLIIMVIQFLNTLFLILLQKKIENLVIECTIFCLQIDIICLIIMNEDNIHSIPFSQLIITQYLIKSLYQDLKIQFKYPLYISTMGISIFMLIYSYCQLDFNTEQPQLITTLIMSLYENLQFPSDPKAQLNQILTESTNPNKLENLYKKKNEFQYDLEHNQPSCLSKESFSEDIILNEALIQSIQNLHEGIVILTPNKKKTQFPFGLKYMNNATKIIFGKETETEFMTYFENLTVYQTQNLDFNEDLLYISNLQRKPSLFVMKQSIDGILNTLKFPQLDNQPQEKQQKYSMKQIIDYILLKQSTQELQEFIVVQTQINYKFSMATSIMIQTSQSAANLDGGPLVEMTISLTKNQCLIIICRDVTHRQKIRCLKEYDKQKSKMLSFVSHEYRSPLNCIIQMLDSVINQNIFKENQDVQEQLQIALDNSNYILNLSNDLLDLAQIKNGKFKVDKVPFNLETLIYECLKMFQLKAKMKRIQLQHKFDNNMPKVVYSDRNRIKQIIINLLSNAFKFTQQGSIIVTITIINELTIRIGVRDDGIGISEEDQQNLFRAFSKVNSEESRKLNQQGVGLGLVISNQIAQTIGSTGLQIESKIEENDHFSYFYFDIPLDRPFKKKISSFKIKEIQLQLQEVDEIISFKKIIYNIREDASTQQSCLHFLLVDDDCFNIFALRRLILGVHKNKKHIFSGDFDIESALTGEEAINKVKNKKCNSNCQGYKIIFMDIEMPIMNGYQTTKQILQINPNQIIVGCSGYTEIDEQKTCLNCGMADYLTKPINETQLILILQKLQ